MPFYSPDLVLLAYLNVHCNPWLTGLQRQDKQGPHHPAESEEAHSQMI